MGVTFKRKEKMRKNEFLKSNELTLGLMLSYIPLLKARLTDLAVNKKELIDGGKPACKALEVRLSGTLADIFGVGTQEYCMYQSFIEFVEPGWSNNETGDTEIHGIEEAKGKIQALLDRFIEKCQPTNENKIKICTREIIDWIMSVKQPFSKEQISLPIEGIIDSHFRLIK